MNLIKELVAKQVTKDSTALVPCFREKLRRNIMKPLCWVHTWVFLFIMKKKYN